MVMALRASHRSDPMPQNAGSNRSTGALRSSRSRCSPDENPTGNFHVSRIPERRKLQITEVGEDATAIVLAGYVSHITRNLPVIRFLRDNGEFVTLLCAFLGLCWRYGYLQ
jgi:hypothetical protein